MLLNRSETLIRAPFDNEAEIEQVVQDFAEQLFGPNILYLPQTRISTIGGKGSVPDAVVIDVEAQVWYIVEAERAVHGTWEHIAPQVSKQLAAVASAKTRELILRAALDQVAQSIEVKRVFEELGIEELAIHGRIHAILGKPPLIAIPIDSIPNDLKEWVQTLRNDAKIWVIEKYVDAENPQRILYSIPDETLPTLSTKSTPTGKVATVSRGSEPWAEMIEAGVLRDGEILYMDYGPRGQPRRTFQGVVRENGIEVDGQVFSPSYAAVRCIRNAGSDRKTANGWVTWKTREGRLIDELYQQLRSAGASEDESSDDLRVEPDPGNVT